MESQYSSCALLKTPLIRYTAAPTKYDTAPYKTICALHLNDDGSERRLFIQTSQDETSPNWMPVEELVVTAFRPLIENPCFLDDCLLRLK